MGHIDFADISRYAAGDLQRDKKRELQEHLRQCGRCRAELDFALNLKRVLSEELTHPRPPEGLLDRVLERRASGDRVILAQSAPDPRPSLTLVSVGIVGLTAVAALLGALFILAPQASAGISSLDVEALPERSILKVEFTSASTLAQEERLVMRTLYRVAGERPHTIRGDFVVSTPLRRAGRARFTGEQRIPSSAVYAAMVVENEDGTQVENQLGRPFEWLARTEEGLPIFEALYQKIKLVGSSDWEAGLLTARKMRELYPLHPETWHLNYLLEQPVTAPEAQDSLRRAYRKHFKRIDQLLGGGRRLVSPDELAGMVRLSRILEEEEAKKRWFGRLNGKYPLHPEAAQGRTVRAYQELYRAPRELLAALEEEWNRSGPATDAAAAAGFETALRLGREQEIRRWALRYLRVRPDLKVEIATRMLTLPATAQLGFFWLKAVADELEEPKGDDRPLGVTVAGYHAQAEQRRKEIHAALGRYLLREDRAPEALYSLEEATSGGWNPGHLQLLARARAAVGDSSGAARALALALLDPFSADSLNTLHAKLSPYLSQAGLSEATDELLTRLEAEIIKEPFPDHTVLRPHGERIRLSSLASSSHTTLLVYWARRSFPAVRDLPQLQRALARLKEHRVQLVTVTPEGSTSALHAFLTRHDYSFPVYHELETQTAQALRRRATPQYAVLDADGWLRVRTADLERALRLATAIPHLRVTN